MEQTEKPTNDAASHEIRRRNYYGKSYGRDSRYTWTSYNATGDEEEWNDESTDAARTVFVRCHANVGGVVASTCGT